MIQVFFILNNQPIIFSKHVICKKPSSSQMVVCWHKEPKASSFEANYDQKHRIRTSKFVSRYSLEVGCAVYTCFITVNDRNGLGL